MVAQVEEGGPRRFSYAKDGSLIHCAARMDH